MPADRESAQELEALADPEGHRLLSLRCWSSSTPTLPRRLHPSRPASASSAPAEVYLGDRPRPSRAHNAQHPGAAFRRAIEAALAGPGLLRAVPELYARIDQPGRADDGPGATGRGPPCFCSPGHQPPGHRHAGHRLQGVPCHAGRGNDRSGSTGANLPGIPPLRQAPAHLVSAQSRRPLDPAVPLQTGCPNRLLSQACCRLFPLSTGA